MSRFKDSREAKEFLIKEIVAQSALDGVPLTEVERKMLYFSETHWTLPDIMEINRQFDSGYDSDEYEEKIAQLIRHARRRAFKADWRNSDWSDAIDLLNKEDHYLLVMI